MKEEKKLKVEIDKGTPNGEQHTLHGEGDEHPGAETGDVVVVVKELPHSIFKRKGADLFFEKSITLSEALTGISFVFQHLDGRKILVKNEEGKVIKPDELKTIKDLGMPFYKKAYVFGNLFVQFKVKFPLKMEKENIDLAQLALAFMKEDVKTESKKGKNKKKKGKKGNVAKESQKEVKEEEKKEE